MSRLFRSLIVAVLLATIACRAHAGHTGLAPLRVVKPPRLNRQGIPVQIIDNGTCVCVGRSQKDGLLILTVAHVVRGLNTRGGDKLQVRVRGRWISASVYARHPNPDIDLAVLVTKPGGL